MAGRVNLLIPHESGNDDVKSNGWESLGKVKQQQQPASITKSFQGFSQKKKRSEGFIELINRLKRIYHRMPPQNQLTLTDQENYYYLFV